MQLRHVVQRLRGGRDHRSDHDCGDHHDVEHDAAACLEAEALWGAAAGATHLITGDVRHFGAYLGERVLGVWVVTPALYPQTSWRSTSRATTPSVAR